jgi:SAM-dependent methyltransferase
MGRFASTVEFYARYREPYPPEFFQKVAEQIGLRGDETLLDVGCGPGMLAIGFAPFVGSCTGLDPEPLMIAAARSAARRAVLGHRDDRKTNSIGFIRANGLWTRTSVSWARYRPPNVIK